MICIPMAGNSTRFYEAGYLIPKFQLEVKRVPLFRLALLSFSKYFETETFLFIIRPKNNCLAFVESELKTLKIKNYLIIQLDEDTRGQADTVALGLTSKIMDEDEHLLIFNIDTIRPNFQYPGHFPKFPWLEAFIAEGEHWSFIDPNPNSDEVSRVVEKQRISNFCSTGMYFFPTIKDYLDVFYLHENFLPNIELYVAPLYQLLIHQNRIVKYSLIHSQDIFLAGTPSEFYALDATILFQSLGI